MRTATMTVQEFAAYIGVRYGTVKRWVSEGLPTVRDWSYGPGSNSANVEVVVDPAVTWVKEQTSRHSAVALHREAFLYAAEREDGAIKLGWSSDPERRMRELRKETGQRHELLCSVPGDKPAELALHERLAAHRIEGGEWFRPHNDVLAAVEEMRATAVG